MIWVSVFFFKQKTAYEMRISDWSSDVCSSDLRKTFQSACRLAMDRSCKELICVPAVNLPLSPPLSPYLLQQQQELSGRQEITSKIGRASCRERVCRKGRCRWSA